MPEVKLKALHMAKDMTSLNKKAEIDIKSVAPKRLIKSAQTVLSKAEESDKEKDEENAYILYMKYFEIVKTIQKHPDYKLDKKYYSTMLNGKYIEKTIQRAEELSKSLERRYQLLADLNNEEKKEEREKERQRKIRIEKEKKMSALISPAKVETATADDGLISCKKLYSLTTEKVSSFLIVDIRSKEEFQSSSMKISTVINIPEEYLKRGLTANKAGRELNENSRLLWGRRHSFDYIIICDWCTDEKPFPPAITALIDAMEKWDPGKPYRASPVVLEGGYEMFALMYPMLVSNPKVNSISKMSLNVPQNHLRSDISNTFLNFGFPDLDTGFLCTPSPDKSIEYPSLGEGSIPTQGSRSNETPPSSRPSVNRDLKPRIPMTKRRASADSSNDADGSSGVASTNPMNNAMGFDSPRSSSSSPPPPYPVTGGWVSPPSSSSPDTDEEKRGGRELPAVPSRSLKPQELLDSLKAKRKEMEEEQSALEQSLKAEKDAFEKLEEVEETRRIQETTQDEKMLSKLMAKENHLREELEEKNEYVLQMEKKYSILHEQNEEMRKLLNQLFSEQLKIDDSSSPDHVSYRQKMEKEALRVKEENQNALLKQVEELRKKKKEKEKAMKEEEERKRAREEKKKKDLEETREHLRWATERNTRNRENFSPDLKDGRTAPTKRGGETYTAKLRTSPRSSPVRGGTNIKRSHSALNLSQLKDEESGLESPSIVPSFDRNLKPLSSPLRRNVNAARHRNFEPKYGSVGQTKTGLKNLGNTCYMNSIVQCLSNTFPLAKYFFEGHYSDDLNANSKQRGEVAEEVGAVVRALWCGQYRSIAMWDLKSVVGRFHKAFQGYDQHDSHEFLIKLMDWLHEDLNLVYSRPPKMEEQNFADHIRDEVAAETVMDALRERDESIVRDLFHGLHRSVIVCHTCNHRSLTFEPFSVLTVSFPAGGRSTLKDMLYDFYRETRIEYKCSKCQRVRNCSRKFDIWKLPPVLIIHLNRFEHDVLLKKKQNFVEFPLDNLNLLEYTSGPTRYHSYDLYGVSNHYGTIDGGHYTAFCKSPNKCWYKFDDHEVYDLPRESVKTSAAYILFYEAVKSKSSL